MCGPLFLTVVSICLLSVGTSLGFLTAALFATGAVMHQLWPAAAVIAGGSVLAAVFAVRGARW